MPVLAVSVVGAVMVGGCTTEVVGLQDAGIYVADAGVSDAPPTVSDARLTFDAGVSDAAEEDAPATR